jgi:hypothetical protein
MTGHFPTAGIQSSTNQRCERRLNAIVLIKNVMISHSGQINDILYRGNPHQVKTSIPQIHRSPDPK